jgi:hypothetical protein
LKTGLEEVLKNFLRFKIILEKSLNSILSVSNSVSHSTMNFMQRTTSFHTKRRSKLRSDSRTKLGGTKEQEIFMADLPLMTITAPLLLPVSNELSCLSLLDLSACSSPQTNSKAKLISVQNYSFPRRLD